MCACELGFMRRGAQASEGRARTRTRRCGRAGLKGGCCFWPLQSPESLSTPEPREPAGREGEKEGREGENTLVHLFWRVLIKTSKLSPPDVDGHRMGC